MNRRDSLNQLLLFCSCITLAPWFLGPLVSCGGSRSDEKTPVAPAAEDLALGQQLDFTPNILLVTVDTLRADHLGCYGYARDTSPTLDAFAEEAVLFEHALSTMATTLPSHLSILTGLYPHQHGFRANHGRIPHPFASGPGRYSAVELLNRSGYHTAAFVSGATVKKQTGIAAGFEHFDEPTPVNDEDFYDFRKVNRVGTETTARALAWLQDSPPEPFFLWVHYWDTHEPNMPPAEYAQLFKTDEALERTLAERQVNIDTLNESFSAMEISRMIAPEKVVALMKGQEVEPPQFDDENLRKLYNDYDGCVRLVDDCFGQLLTSLERGKLSARTMVAFTSDHGQALGQHDWLEHGTIWHENVHVPLLVRFPDGVIPQPQRIAGTMSLVDLMPTLLARFESPAGPVLAEQAEGRDLLAGHAARPVLSQRAQRVARFGPGDRYCITDGPWRLYFETSGKTRELYHLERDPGERTDLSDAEPVVVERLGRDLAEILGRGARTDSSASIGAGEMTAEQRRMLILLGYLDPDEE